jgi:hypothetical protein
VVTEAESQRAAGLLALALHESTPQNERHAAAMALCRFLQRAGLAETLGRAAQPQVNAPARPEAYESVEDLRSPRDLARDVAVGPTLLDHQGWRWVVTGSAHFCRSCGMYDRKKRAACVIASGSMAAERRGEYQHEECHRRAGG